MASSSRRDTDIERQLHILFIEALVHIKIAGISNDRVVNDFLHVLDRDREWFDAFNICRKDTWVSLETGRLNPLDFSIMLSNSIKENAPSKAIQGLANVYVTVGNLLTQRGRPREGHYWTHTAEFFDQDAFWLHQMEYEALMGGVNKMNSDGSDKVENELAEYLHLSSSSMQ